MLPLLSALLIKDEWERPLPFIPIPLDKKRKVGDYFDFEFIEESHPMKDFFKNFRKNYDEGKDLLQYIEDNVKKSKHFNFIRGVYYEYGLKGAYMNESKARELYTLAAKEGSNMAKCRIAILDNSLNCPSDCWSCQLANSFSPIDDSFVAALAHTYELEYSYKNFAIERFPLGKVPTDTNKTELRLTAFLEIQAERGDAGAKIAQAVKKLNVKDYKGAIADFEESINMGSTAAYGLLGRLYKYKDPAKSLKYYQKGIESGDVYSITDMALHTLRNNPSSHFAPDLLKLLQKAVEAKSPKATGEYGYSMYKREKGFSGTKEEAIRYIDDAIKLGYAPAIYYKAQTNVPTAEKEYLKTLMIRKSYLADAINTAYVAASHQDYQYAALIYMRYRNAHSPEINYNFQILKTYDKTITGNIETEFDKFKESLTDYFKAKALIDRNIKPGFGRIVFHLYLLTYHPKLMFKYLILPGIFTILFIVLIILTFCRIKKTQKKMKKE